VIASPNIRRQSSKSLYFYMYIVKNKSIETKSNQRLTLSNIFNLKDKVKDKKHVIKEVFIIFAYDLETKSKHESL
jgi:hypothetical protein